MRAQLSKVIESVKNNVKNCVFWLTHFIVIPLRYKIEVKGAECLDPKKGGVDSSILFLSNHSSHIDGTILAVAIIRRGIPLSIWALDMTFKLPYLRWAARHKDTVKVVKVPNINERRSEKHLSQLHKLVTRTGDGLRKGKNFLIFPSGRCKLTPIEKIDGKSAVPLVIRQHPNVNIILVKVRGLWGSRFSCATTPDKRWATRSIRGLDMFWQSLKMIVLNGIFFIPKRKVVIELSPAPEDFPRHGSRLEIDRYLERYYNEAWGPKGEPLNRIPDYFWKATYTQHEYTTKHYNFNLDQVSKPIRNAVVRLVADKADVDCKDIQFDMYLGRDLGLDSLDIVEILTELESKYAIKRLVPVDLTTVGHLIAVVAKIPIVCEVKSGDFHEVTESHPLSTRLSQKIKGYYQKFRSMFELAG